MKLLKDINYSNKFLKQLLLDIKLDNDHSHSNYIDSGDIFQICDNIFSIYHLDYNIEGDTKFFIWDENDYYKYSNMNNCSHDLIIRINISKMSNEDLIKPLFTVYNNGGRYGTLIPIISDTSTNLICETENVFDRLTNYYIEDPNKTVIIKVKYCRCMVRYY